jgi:hypothetical protein
VSSHPKYFDVFLMQVTFEREELNSLHCDKLYGLPSLSQNTYWMRPKARSLSKVRGFRYIAKKNLQYLCNQLAQQVWYEYHMTIWNHNGTGSASSLTHSPPVLMNILRRLGASRNQVSDSLQCRQETDIWVSKTDETSLKRFL